MSRFRFGEIGTTLTRKDPINLVPDDYWLFRKAKQCTLPPPQLSVLENAEVYGRGPLRQDGEYVVESFVMPAQFEQWKRERKHWLAAAERLIRLPERVDRPTAWITDNWSCGYFHWMCDALPRLELLLSEVPASELTLLLPAKIRREPYVLDSLKPFGLGAVRILNRFERLRCRTLWFPSHVGHTGNYDESIMRKIGQRFRTDPVTAIRSEVVKRIYISRSGATRRRIANESDVRSVLQRHDFEFVLTERLSWPDQVRLVASADTLVSNHGAGLTNMMVMSPGAKVMEIRADDDDHNNCYYSLASATELDYFYLLARKETPGQSAHLADVVVDPEGFDRALGEMLTFRTSHSQGSHVLASGLKNAHS